MQRRPPGRLCYPSSLWTAKSRRRPVHTGICSPINKNTSSLLGSSTLAPLAAMMLMLMKKQLGVSGRDRAVWWCASAHPAGLGQRRRCTNLAGTNLPPSHLFFSFLFFGQYSLWPTAFDPHGCVACVPASPATLTTAGNAFRVPFLRVILCLSCNVGVAPQFVPGKCKSLISATT